MQEFSIGTTDAILIGQKSESVFLFLHGNGGSKEEAIAFAQVAVPHGYQVIGIDVPVMGKPWEVLKILEVVKDFLKKNYKSISIRIIIADISSQWTISRKAIIHQYRNP